MVGWGASDFIVDFGLLSLLVFLLPNESAFVFRKENLLFGWVIFTISAGPKEFSRHGELKFSTDCDRSKEFLLAGIGLGNGLGAILIGFGFGALELLLIFLPESLSLSIVSSMPLLPTDDLYGFTMGGGVSLCARIFSVLTNEYISFSSFCVNILLSIFGDDLGDCCFIMVFCLGTTDWVDIAGMS